MASGTQTRHRTSLNRNRALGVLGAVAAALAVWLVADPILGADMTVTQPGRDAIEVGIGPVVFMSLVAALLGWASVAVLERLTARLGARTRALLAVPA